MIMGHEAETKRRAGYNERLFSGGLRAKLHMARFFWLRYTIRRLAIEPHSVLELGCYDGRAVEFLPRMPARYLGLDAGWENAMAMAQQRWAGKTGLEFRVCTKPEEMNLQGETFDMAMALETLEHIPPEDLDGYLAHIAHAVKDGGVFLVSVPNEIGPVFAAKHILKVLLVGKPEIYSFREFICQMLGLTDRVARREHKGFHYGKLIRTLRLYFDVRQVQGMPFSFLPPYLNFGVGIVCSPKIKAIPQ